MPLSTLRSSTSRTQLWATSFRNVMPLKPCSEKWPAYFRSGISSVIPSMPTSVTSPSTQMSPPDQEYPDTSSPLPRLVVYGAICCSARVNLSTVFPGPSPRRTQSLFSIRSRSLIL